LIDVVYTAAGDIPENIIRFPPLHALSWEKIKPKNMTKFEMAKRGLQNELVFFSYEGRELRGVISDTIPQRDKVNETHWHFIPNHLRKAWAAANTEEKKLISDVEVIDIEKIMWCVALK
jgi:hypothetical protein